MHDTEKADHLCSSVTAGTRKSPGIPTNPAERVPSRSDRRTPQFRARMEQAHVLPDATMSGRPRPIRSALGSHRSKESAEFIQFVNPGDLRVAERTCGRATTRKRPSTKKSMMAHGGMLWSAALYNNGVVPVKNTQFGEFYISDGTPARAEAYPAVTPDQTTPRGHGCRSFSRCSAGSCRSRATCCASSSAAAAGRSNPAIRIRKKSRAGRRTA